MCVCVCTAVTWSCTHEFVAVGMNRVMSVSVLAGNMRYRPGSALCLIAIQKERSAASAQQLQCRSLQHVPPYENTACNAIGPLNRVRSRLHVFCVTSPRVQPASTCFFVTSVFQNSVHVIKK